MEAQNDHDLSVVSLLIKGKIGVRSPLFQLRRMPVTSHMDTMVKDSWVLQSKGLSSPIKCLSVTQH